MTRIAIDPITRIEGHLRIEVEVQDGQVTDAWSSGTMFRGIEMILRDRDPRDAWVFAQRICGVCTTVHALASVRAVENAIGITIPDNARLIRNLIAGAQLVQVQSARRRGIRRMLGFYLFLRRKLPGTIGHNPLAGLAYTIVFILFLLQIVTGLALYALPFSGGFWPAVFGWITTDFGVQPVRLLHDIIMWLILAFMVHHVYTAILIDIEERGGLMSSIFSGFKAFTAHQIEDARAEETPGKRRAWFVRKARREHV